MAEEQKQGQFLTVEEGKDSRRQDSLQRKETAYLRTLTQYTGDNPQDLGGEEGGEGGGESSEYESFEDEMEQKPLEEQEML